MITKHDELKKAKDNVVWLLKNADGSVDMKGLVFWVQEVERLREEIKKEL